MPELPEVETIVKQLRAKVIGKTIVNLTVIDPKLKHVKSKKLPGTKISDVQRKGKNIILTLQGQDSLKYLAIHLRMTGALIWSKKATENNSHKIIKTQIHKISVNDKPRISFILSDGILDFIDTRRFGVVEIYENMDQIGPFGIDPFDAKFSTDFLKAKFKNKSINVKTALLDQNIISGIGNIYASEILFLSGINPARTAKSLNNNELSRIIQSSKKILRTAIKFNGTTFSDFKDADGQTGGFQKYLKVYQREDMSCVQCRNSIIRIAQAQRSTFYCGKCQK